MSADFAKLLEVQFQEAKPQPTAPTPHPQSKFTAESLIQLMILHPSWTPTEFAQAFGRKSGWFFSVLASTAFQAELEPHRHLILDPALTATMEERMRAMALQSLSVLEEKLGGKEVSDQTLLKALEVGVKALGMGTPQALPPPVIQESGPEAVARKIMAAMDLAKSRRAGDAVDVQSREVESDN